MYGEYSISSLRKTVMGDYSSMLFPEKNECKLIQSYVCHLNKKSMIAIVKAEDNKVENCLFFKILRYVFMDW